MFFVNNGRQPWVINVQKLPSLPRLPFLAVTGGRSMRESEKRWPNLSRSISTFSLEKEKGLRESKCPRVLAEGLQSEKWKEKKKQGRRVVFLRMNVFSPLYNVITARGLAGLTTYLWDFPFFPAGCLCLGNTFGPTCDIPCAVIRIALEHKLPFALFTGKQSSKSHPICNTVQDLKQ